MPTINSYEKNKHLIGKKFNKWTILDIIIHDNKHHTFALARCECGTEKEVRLSYITNNKTLDCGCGHHERMIKSTLDKYANLINTTINSWTILKIIPPDEELDYTTAMCRCECGTEKRVKLSYILNNKSKNCGCGRKKTISKIFSKDLVGQRFGKLTVVENVEGRSKTGRKLYKCKCDCGNEIILHTNQLTTHHTNSCGCLVSYYNMYINRWLTDQGIDHETEYSVTIDDVTYRFDFYLPQYNLFIEYDGEQHYKTVRYHGNNIEANEEIFKKTQQRDKIKNEYCTANNINLLRIPYWEKENIETIIINHLQRLSEKGFAA